MQYYIYEHADGTLDVGPYKPFQPVDVGSQWRDESIMLLRTTAANRGASPVEIQRNVEKLSNYI